jgi:hypothetical protein
MGFVRFETEGRNPQMADTRQRVECIEHDGAHTGTVVHDFGFAYGVAWTGLNTDPAVGKAHGKDSLTVAYDAVRPVAKVADR